MITKRLGVMVLAGVLVGGLAVTPTAAADEPCYGATSETRDIETEPLFWESTEQGGTIYHAFTPLTHESGSEWNGIHSWAGECGLIESIVQCLEDGGEPGDCLPE